jgi:hypothetical protein
MKAIHIDAKNKTITEIDYSGRREDIYSLLDIQMFECQQLPSRNGQGNDIFIDEEGICASEVKFGFRYAKNCPTAGNGLVLGLNFDNGETIATNYTLEEVKANVKFYDNHNVFKAEYNAYYGEKII